MTPEEIKAAEDAAKAAADAKAAEDAKLTPEQRIEKAKEEARVEAKKESDLAWQKKFDQKNTELQKEKAAAEELRKAKMTDEEKKQHDFAEKEKLLAEKEATITAKEIDNAKLRLMSEKGLPIEFSDYITGSSSEEVTKKIESFKVLFEKSVAQAIETRMKGAGAAPQCGAGGAGGDSLEADYQKAIKEKDNVKAMRLARLIDEKKRQKK